MSHELRLNSIPEKHIHRLAGFAGTRPDGQRLSFTNYYMELDGLPFFGVSGEAHYARLWEERWEDELLKCKAGGVNILSTYVFWIHHEEREGDFDFTGRRDLRRFVSLCGQLGLYAIVRVGPFAHGEVRNGGLPDWLYGKPFSVRSLDEGFLRCVRKWYRAVSRELDGLWYKDGGPIIAVQLDNEYMHSAAPWEMTVGCSDEWLPSGGDGEAYMLRLCDIAREEGLDPPFFTCTGWGGAPTPAGMMPLWGGYAFRPWLFYRGGGEHPATEEYLYRDYHSAEARATESFSPSYPPESKPYLCCEMGGGMFCSYRYRFQLPYESVDAMANCKLASGCNMLGYYMYHGGTNPMGRGGLFLNEGQTPKRSYDFQAPLGEFGQARDSYRRLRALHLLTRAFAQALCPMKTALPEGGQDIDPRDTRTLRYAVRVGPDGAGFLFLNAYQDHVAMEDKLGESIVLRLPKGDIAFSGLALSAGESCVLPFNLPIGGVLLLSSHAQPLTVLDARGETAAFFFAPEGMAPQYAFPAGTHIEPESHDLRVEAGERVTVSGPLPVFTARQGSTATRFITLSRAQSLAFDVISFKGQAVAVLTDAALLATEDSLRLEHDRPDVSICVFPGGILPIPCEACGAEGPFTQYSLKCAPVTIEPIVRQVGPTRYTVGLPPWDMGSVKDLRLMIEYRGDVGRAFLGGELISDNFSNGAPWEIGLAEHSGPFAREPLTIYITPAREGAYIDASSAMAGRKQAGQEASGGLDAARVQAVYEWRVY